MKEWNNLCIIPIKAKFNYHDPAVNMEMLTQMEVESDKEK